MLLTKIDANRKWTDQRDVAVPLHCKSLPFNARLDCAVHGLEKIIAVRLNMEADQVGAQEAVNELALPGTNAEGLRIGPRNVPENCDAGVGPRIFQHARQQCKVIV